MFRLSAPVLLRRSLWLFPLALLLWPTVGQAHALNTDLSRLSRTDVVLTYLQLGFTHILPLGLDHILFVLGLFILDPRLKPVLWQATAFTVAHSITLGLAAAGLVTPLSSVVEPLIALSILFVAIENLLTDRLQPWRVALVFGFGLLHGLGFAGALADIGLPKHAFMESLISFNVGVELGQVTIILLAWLLVGKWFGNKPWYKQRIVVPVSLLIGAVALWWTVERVFFV
ncbi:HupE/UreJ family protein [Hymenobacter busanensis]|uniref:HupE/UreJ family protein n=1 Tax=Hymenobacter busanensis TaxID=2607656 RepID=A0A7L5A092_9BACT|nr:HupE/UreJ family protein [Hymenobacter busanensis]KAA9338632.1 HupE/UreJ family protein [Hymenobacter busanensis]QHJ08938.1 HupE/UreJ family protein [Hymenobacter busanensis]